MTTATSEISNLKSQIPKPKNGVPKKFQPAHYQPGSVQDIPLERLHRHPDNRNIPASSVQELAESLKEHGQKEPARVRELPDPIGHYELLSGERRYVAAGLAGMDTLRCVIETHDDSQAIVELAIANAAREDLDPIERAQLLTRMIAPIDKGGAGMDRAAAGRVFGLESESGVKNALRLLQIPKYFRDLVKSKKLSVKQARLLVPYPDGLLEQLAQWLTSKKNVNHWAVREFFEDESGVANALRRFVDDCTRPVDSKAEHNHGYQDGGRWKCLIPAAELESQREKLHLIEIPHEGKQGETRLVAMNAKAWHALQDPLVKAKLAAKKNPKASKTKSKGGKTAEPTAAELKAKAAKSESQLNAFTAEWARLALRCTIARRYEWPGGCVEYLLPWLLEEIAGGSSIGKLNEWAISECTPQANSIKRFTAAGFQTHMEIIALDFPMALWRIALWPSATNSNPHPDLGPPGIIPERLPHLNGHVVDELAIAVGVSLETVWAAAEHDCFERELVRRWLTRHTAEQLEKLAKELSTEKNPCVLPKPATRAQRVDALLDCHRNTPKKKPLPLPKRIAALSPKPKTTAKPAAKSSGSLSAAIKSAATRKRPGSSAAEPTCGGCGTRIGSAATKGGAK